MRKVLIAFVILMLCANVSYSEDKTEFQAAAESTPKQEAEYSYTEAEVQAQTIEAVSPGTITFSFKDADIRNVLRLIAAKSGINIVYGPEVTGMVNMELKDVPWEQALSLVLDLNGFSYQKVGNVIKVMKKEDIQKEPLSTEVFVLNYAKAEDASKSVEKILSERGSIKVDTRSNAIVVTDIPANINKVEDVLKKIDMRTPQVLIETKIVEMSDGRAKDLGLKWTSLKAYTIGIQNPSRKYDSTRKSGNDHTDLYETDSERVTEDEFIYSYDSGTASETLTDTLTNTIGHTLTDTFTRSLLKSDIRSAILSADDFNIILSALQSETDIQLISNPSVVAANNENAQIKIVEEYPIPNYTFDTATSTFTISGFDYKDIGVVFDVMPNVSSDGYITMKMEPQVSKLLDEIPFSAGGSTVLIPLIGRKKASTKLVIKSGDTLAIGGLVDENEKNTITKVPLLGDIPVLGRLFRHDSTETIKKDVIFFITAIVVDENSKRLIQQDGPPLSESKREIYNKLFPERPKAILADKTAIEKSEVKGNRGYIEK
jgi:type IV pilus assembly protein PilQ